LRAGEAYGTHTSIEMHDRFEHETGAKKTKDIIMNDLNRPFLLGRSALTPKSLSIRDGSVRAGFSIATSIDVFPAAITSSRDRRSTLRIELNR
jgi:hypothetical protein